MIGVIESPQVGTRPSQVELWLLDPEQISVLAPMALDLLSRAEWDEGLRLREETDRRLWAGRQAALRVVLGSYMGLNARDVRLRRDVRGKPEIDGLVGPRFSVSACEGWWLAAFSDQDIGVDLELIRPIREIDAIASQNFSEREWADIQAEPSEARRLSQFYRCWTRKEAMLKMLGLGLAGLSGLRKSVSAPAAWLEDLDLQQGMAASLALVRPPTWVRRRTWDDSGSSVMSKCDRKKFPILDPRSAAAEMTMSLETGEEKQSSAFNLSSIGVQELERLEKQAYLWLHMELPTVLETLPRSGRFVDLGCGTGMQANAVAAACPDAQIFGFDADALAVEHCQQHYVRTGLHFECRRMEQGPPPDFPLADVALLRFVLMHLSNPMRALESARAWLKPGGILHVIEPDDRGILFEPEVEWMPELMDLMQSVQKRRGGDRHLGGVLPDMLGSTGWRIAGRRQFSLEPLAAAAAIPKVFLPVAEYYMSEAQRLEMVLGKTYSKLKQGLEQVKEGTLVITKAIIPVHHVWAQRLAEVIT